MSLALLSAPAPVEFDLADVNPAVLELIWGGPLPTPAPPPVRRCHRHYRLQGRWLASCAPCAAWHRAQRTTS